ncbi:MAG: bifunctional GNAT family N-acetyltransferase/class I SAM-dependent methyltransferase [Candidatus Eisenbacteria bacterium]
MSIILRAASEKDIEQLLAFSAALNAEDGPAIGLTPFDRERAAAGFRGLIASEALGLVWMIETGGRAAGYLVLTWGYSIEHHGRTGLIDELFVEAGQRNRGLGRRAIREAADACRARGMRTLQLELTGSNLRARRLYAREGFREQGRALLSMDLPPASDPPDLGLRRKIYEGLDELTQDRRTAIHQAYSLLPALACPRILDVGCGRGGPTIELARLSGGPVTAIDTDGEALEELTARAAREGLSARIRTHLRSMTALDFPARSFDLIWAEASIHSVGFEAGLDALRRFLDEPGYLVIHEMVLLRPDPPREIAAYWSGLFPGIRTLAEYEAQIESRGYRRIGSFTLPEGFWWENYFQPLEQRIVALRTAYAGNPGALQLLHEAQRQVELQTRFPGWYGSAYMALST